MSFSVKKDARGVVIVGVDGQLIVGDRQELTQKVLDAFEGGSGELVGAFTASAAAGPLP